MSVRPSTYVVKYLIETYILYAKFLFSANRCLRSVLTSAKRLEMWLLFYIMFLVTNLCCINLYPVTYQYIYQVSKWQDKQLVSWETFSLASELRTLLHCKPVLLLVWSSNVLLFSDDLLLIWSKNVSCKKNCTALTWKRFFDCCSFSLLNLVFHANRITNKCRSCFSRPRFTQLTTMHRKMLELQDVANPHGLCVGWDFSRNQAWYHKPLCKKRAWFVFAKVKDIFKPNLLMFCIQMFQQFSAVRITIFVLIKVTNKKRYVQIQEAFQWLRNNKSLKPERM